MRPSFTICSSENQYQSDTESTSHPRWRIRSGVQRSCSAVDIDGFISMKRRKPADSHKPMTTNSTPLPYHRNCSFFSVGFYIFLDVSFCYFLN
ncbi:unnamed protein product [Thelazia callipaeda]|uniref:Uncharacterized protein n=1 Tax=Thelazia callipaeda TaxID=103827 RepID=A0A3P7KK98_THECL|nr:unnamed protein product [Thelazia callipaeda]